MPRACHRSLIVMLVQTGIQRLPSVLFFRSRAFTVPSGQRPTFSCLSKRIVGKEKDTRSPRIGFADVPCVARNPVAGANSAIHGLKHARLSPPGSCATRRCHGTENQKRHPHPPLGTSLRAPALAGTAQAFAGARAMASKRARSPRQRQTG